MTKQGKLFVLEGPDGVGKSTLAKGLIHRLNIDEIHFERLAFPGNDAGTLGQLVYEFHHNPEQFGVKSVNPTCVQILHIAAHIDVIERHILPALENGKNIILDRFWWSTLVYGKVYGVNSRSLEAMLNMEFIHWNEVLPTAVFLIGRSASLLQEKPADKWGAINTSYYELANEQKQRYPVYHINNDEDIAATLNNILQIITEFADDSILKQGFRKQKKPNFSNSVKVAAPANITLNAQLDQAALRISSPASFTRLSPAKSTEVFDTYWRFAAERQKIFFRRLEGIPQPWTEDPILRRHKFTNAYRASDRVSQYLIKHVIYNGDQSPEEVFFRIILFKVFNRIETWELLERAFETIRFSEYAFEQYDTVLTNAMDDGQKIFSAAYIMPSGGTLLGYSKKHRNYLKLLERMLEDEVPFRIAEAKSMSQAFELLRSYPMMGDFLAYQYIIDINYSQLTNFSEMSFVVPGPGAKNGIRKCFQSFGGLNEVDIIQLMADRQEDEFNRLGLDFPSLWGRPLQLIDCQNLFCEVDKYARIAHPQIKGIGDRKRIKQIFQKKTKPIEYWYPPKWEINHLIQKGTQK